MKASLESIVADSVGPLSQLKKESNSAECTKSL